jgi:hypothetical protein
MPPETVMTCKQGEIGPFYVFEDQNRVESFDPVMREIKTKLVCMEGRLEHTNERTIIHTKHFRVIAPRFGNTSEPYLWNKANPDATDGRFDALYTAYGAEEYVSRIAALGIYPGGIDDILGQLAFDVSTLVFPNAFYSPDAHMVTLGMVMNQCGLGADQDVFLHELEHGITCRLNPHLGRTYSEDDLEGMAMHEALSDFGPAANVLDAELGEAETVCLELADALSPDRGIRTVRQEQPFLIPDTESHGRSSIYAPFLWNFIESPERNGPDLTKLLLRNMQAGETPEAKKAALEAARRTARDIMTVLAHIMVEFLPARPSKKDFVKAFLNALNDFRTRPNIPENFKFDINEFLKITFYEAAINQIIFGAEAAELVEPNGDFRKALYPLVTDPVAEVSRRAVNKSYFEKEYERGRQVYYQQYYNKYPIEGAGIRFIKVAAGIQMLDTSIVPAPTTSGGGYLLTPQAAWQRIDLGAIDAVLELRVRQHLITKEERAFVLRGLNRARQMPPPKHVLVRGKDGKLSGGVQYKFETPAATIYVDSATGAVNIARRTFH